MKSWLEDNVIKKDFFKKVYAIQNVDSSKLLKKADYNTKIGDV